MQEGEEKMSDDEIRMLNRWVDDHFDMTGEEVRKALKVSSLYDYPGTLMEAKHAILDWQESRARMIGGPALLR